MAVSIGSLSFAIYFGLECARLRAREQAAFGAIFFVKYFSQQALQSDPHMAAMMLRGIMSRAGEEFNDQRLDLLVKDACDREGRRIVQYLRERTGDDLGDDPAKWVEKYSPQADYYLVSRARLPLAYTYVATMAMIDCVNHYAPRLHLPIDVPVKRRDIRFLSPPTPYYYGGRIQVKNFSFSILDRGISIFKLADDGYQSFGIPDEAGESSRTLMERASRMKYTVSTNDIYRMATNWLEALDINVAELERADPPCIDKYPVFHSSRGLVPNPVLSVVWQSPRVPGYDPTEVSVDISAVSGELLKLEDERGAFKDRKLPLIMIRDVDRLLAIPDSDFLRFTPSERSDLVFRYAGIHCTTDGNL